MDLTFEGKAVRVVGAPDDPMWVARDVAEVLGISASTLSERLSAMPQEWVDEFGLTDTIGRTQQFSVVKEPGLYALIFRSEKPEAQRFQRWVFEVVLPEIRRTGSFGQGSRSERRPQGFESIDHAVWASIAMLERLQESIDRLLDAWKIAALLMEGRLSAEEPSAMAFQVLKHLISQTAGQCDEHIRFMESVRAASDRGDHSEADHSPRSLGSGKRVG